MLTPKCTCAFPCGGTSEYCPSAPANHCPAHGEVYGEGDICGECERLGQRELDLCKRIHPHTNFMFLHSYLRRREDAAVPLSFSNHKHRSLRDIIESCWSRDLGKDQCLIECMIKGYALCVAKPLIDSEFARHQAEYEAWEAGRDQQLISDGHAELVRGSW